MLTLAWAGATIVGTPAGLGAAWLESRSSNFVSQNESENATNMGPYATRAS
jgi:hypothetical protein